MSATQERTEKLQLEAKHYSATIRTGANSVLKDALLDNMVNDFMQRVSQLGDDGKNVFNGSVVLDIAENGTEVMHCAMLLFFGYLDNATTFAEGHGGGGGGSDLPWGRDDDEDDRAWARRCLMMAHHMMRPKSGRKPKR